MSLVIHVDRANPARTYLRLDGRLDSNTAPEFEKKLDVVLTAPPRAVVCDLAKLEYISSAGLRCFARIQKVMRQADGEALMVNVQPGVQKVFDMVKALPGKNFFNTIKELDQYLDAQIRRLK